MKANDAATNRRVPVVSLFETSDPGNRALMEAPSSPLSSRAQPRDLLCAPAPSQSFAFR